MNGEFKMPCGKVGNKNTLPTLLGFNWTNNYKLLDYNDKIIKNKS